MKTKKQFFFSTIFVAVLVCFDQLTKAVAVAFLKGNAPIPIISGVFELQYLENTSAAFGMDPISILHRIFHFDVFIQDPQLYLNVRMLFFYCVTIVMILLLVLFGKKLPNEPRFRPLELVTLCMISGAVGNLIDRLVQQYVVDFLYFKLIDFPIFNVADIYVTCAAAALFVLGLFYYKDEDVERIFPSRKEKE